MEASIKMAEDFNPKIIAFCCNWCAYAGADLAGVATKMDNIAATTIFIMTYAFLY